MTTLRADADVLVLGSGLGGLVAGSYLARAGLRVVLLEEAAHGKRPAFLRDPFLVPGLARDGSVRHVIRDLAVPLLDQEFHRDDPSFQVILPGARIDVRPLARDLGAELAAYGVADAEETRAWLEGVGAQSDETRRELEQELSPVRRLARGSSRGLRPPRVRSALPAPPVGAAAFIAAQLGALSGLEPADAAPAPALLLDGARSANLRMPHSGSTLLGTFRRRFLALHGQIWPIGEFALVGDRRLLGVDLERTRCLARALVVAVAREPLRQYLGETSEIPGWLAGGVPVLETRSRLFRAERDSLPVGLGSRVVVADGLPGKVYWLAQVPDADQDQSVWLVASGPGAAALDPETLLGGLAPFAAKGITHVESTPEPRWDLDSGELRFPLAESPNALRHRLPVAMVGPELAPGLGVEGEVLQARRVAIRLANLLGSPRELH